MQELENLKREASNLVLPKSRNKPSLAIKLLYPHIEQALQLGVFKKDIWRILVECDLFGKNSYSGFTRILDKVTASKESTLNPKPEPKPVVTAKIPVAKKPEPKPSSQPVKAKEEEKPKTEHEPIWPKDEKPSFVYNPIPDPSKLF